MAPGVPILQSPQLLAAGFRHAFFTRLGGVSSGEYASLNFAASTGDEPEHVAANVERAGAALGVPTARVHFLSQVHGVETLLVDERDDRDEVVHRVGDALAARGGADLACGVRSADCGTLLVGDPVSGAVCAIHAGWRGTVRGVVPAALARLRDLAGPRAQLIAAVGPHIKPCCFEVDDDVAAELAACSSAAERAVRRSPGAKPHVDLRAILHAQLVAAGVAADRIDDVRGCTVCDPERFFSFRRQGARSGRLLSAIVPRRPG
jgi:YfiH family protein